MKDYRVTITVKNNKLISAMRQEGFDTAASLSRATGVSQSAICSYLRLKQTPLYRSGFTPSIVRIAKVLRTLPEDLFPEQHLVKALSRNSTSVELDICDVKNILDHRNPEKLIEFKELKSQIKMSLSTLTGRDREVIEHRYGLEGREAKTLEECGKLYGVHKERVRQIEARALRLLRHPGISGNLREYADFNNE